MNWSLIALGLQQIGGRQADNQVCETKCIGNGSKMLFTGGLVPKQISHLLGSFSIHTVEKVYFKNYSDNHMKYYKYKGFDL